MPYPQKFNKKLLNILLASSTLCLIQTFPIFATEDSEKAKTSMDAILKKGSSAPTITPTTPAENEGEKKATPKPANIDTFTFSAEHPMLGKAQAAGKGNQPENQMDKSGNFNNETHDNLPSLFLPTDKLHTTPTAPITPSPIAAKSKDDTELDLQKGGEIAPDLKTHVSPHHSPEVKDQLKMRRDAVWGHGSEHAETEEYEDEPTTPKVIAKSLEHIDTPLPTPEKPTITRKSISYAIPITTASTSTSTTTTNATTVPTTTTAPTAVTASKTPVSANDTTGSLALDSGIIQEFSRALNVIKANAPSEAEIDARNAKKSKIALVHQDSKSTSPKTESYFSSTQNRIFDAVSLLQKNIQANISSISDMVANNVINTQDEIEVQRKQNQDNLTKIYETAKESLDSILKEARIQKTGEQMASAEFKQLTDNAKIYHTYLDEIERVKKDTKSASKALLDKIEKRKEVAGSVDSTRSSSSLDAKPSIDQTAKNVVSKTPVATRITTATTTTNATTVDIPPVTTSTPTITLVTPSITTQSGDSKATKPVLNLQTQERKSEKKIEANLEAKQTKQIPEKAQDIKSSNAPQTEYNFNSTLMHSTIHARTPGICKMVRLGALDSHEGIDIQKLKNISEINRIYVEFAKPLESELIAKRQDPRATAAEIKILENNLNEVRTARFDAEKELNLDAADAVYQLQNKQYQESRQNVFSKASSAQSSSSSSTTAKPEVKKIDNATLPKTLVTAAKNIKTNPAAQSSSSILLESFKPKDIQDNNAISEFTPWNPGTDVIKMVIEDKITKSSDVDKVCDENIKDLLAQYYSARDKIVKENDEAIKKLNPDEAAKITCRNVEKNTQIETTHDTLFQKAIADAALAKKLLETPKEKRAQLLDSTKVEKEKTKQFGDTIPTNWDDELPAVDKSAFEPAPAVEEREDDIWTSMYKENFIESHRKLAQLKLKEALSYVQQNEGERNDPEIISGIKESIAVELVKNYGLSVETARTCLNAAEQEIIADTLFEAASKVAQESKANDDRSQYPLPGIRKKPVKKLGQKLNVRDEVPQRDVALQGDVPVIRPLREILITEESLKPLNADVSGIVTNLVQNTIGARMLPNSPTAIAAGDQIASVDRGIWISGSYAHNNQKSTKIIQKSKSNSKGLSVGFDTQLNADNLIGLAISHINSDLKFANKADKMKISSNVLSLYGEHNLTDKLVLNEIFSIARSNIKTSQVKVDAANKIATGKFRNDSMNLQATLGYKLDTGSKLNLMPMIGVIYDGFKDSAYTEKGTVSHDLSVKAKNVHVIRAIVGIKASIPIFAANDFIITPGLSASYERSLFGKKQKIESKYGWFRGFTTLKEDKTSKNIFNLGASLGVEKDNIELAAVYSSRLAHKSVSHQGTLRLKVKF